MASVFAKRWCVIYSDPMLCYYESADPNAKMKGVCALQNASISCADDKISICEASKATAIKFKARSANDAMAWAEQLRAAASGEQSPAAPSDSVACTSAITISLDASIAPANSEAMTTAEMQTHAKANAEGGVEVDKTTAHLEVADKLQVNATPVVSEGWQPSSNTMQNLGAVVARLHVLSQTTPPKPVTSPAEASSAEAVAAQLEVFIENIEDCARLLLLKQLARLTGRLESRLSKGLGPTTVGPISSEGFITCLEGLVERLEQL